MSEQKVILSCIQPTGKLHLGRYFGAVENWVRLQKEYECFYGIVDYHAITMPYQPIQLRENVWDLAINLLACGINSDYVFIQSMVPEHAELAWILGCMCSYGELSRMTQFKDKTQQVKEKDKDNFVSSGLFTYPVLQAADILIYHANYVPVGKDQDQHLELTRNIAQRFNHVTGKDYFKMPEPLYTETPKIMSTSDPSRKMSASAGEKHFIDVFGPVDQIRKQLRTAMTDVGEVQTGKMSEGVANLFLLLKASKSEQYTTLLEEYAAGGMQYSKLKDAVADSIIAMVAPIQQKRNEFLIDKQAIKESVTKSSAKIRERAAKTLHEVKAITGLG